MEKIEVLPRVLSPSEKKIYSSGFDAAINLFDQYFEEEKISYSEAKHRVNQIKSIMDFSHPGLKKKDSLKRFR